MRKNQFELIPSSGFQCLRQKCCGEGVGVFISNCQSDNDHTFQLTAGYLSHYILPPLANDITYSVPRPYINLMTGDQQRASEARNIIIDRELRYQIFPGGMFDEFGWNMLLQLFVSLTENIVMSETRLCSLSRATIPVGQRWLTHLVTDGHIETRENGTDVFLTSSAIEKLRRYLDGIAKRVAPTNS